MLVWARRIVGDCRWRRMAQLRICWYDNLSKRGDELVREESALAFESDWTGLATTRWWLRETSMIDGLGDRRLLVRLDPGSLVAAERCWYSCVWWRSAANEIALRGWAGRGASKSFKEMQRHGHDDTARLLSCISIIVLGTSYIDSGKVGLVMDTSVMYVKRPSPHHPSCFGED